MASRPLCYPSVRTDDLPDIDWPQISLVTPCYNMADYLDDTIQSILSQGYPNLEYVIIDGGSTDGSVDIIKRYEEQLSDWVSEPDGGMYDAINKGFQRTSGDVMGWLNADDIYHPGALFTVGEIFANMPDVRWMHGHPNAHDSAGRTVQIRERRVWSRYNYYLGDYHWVNQASTFWRRGLWDEAGGYVDDTLKYAGDMELWTRFFRHAKLYTASTILGGFRSRTGQFSTAYRDTYIEEVESVLANERTRLDPAVEQRYQRLRRMKTVFNALERLRILNIDGLKRRLGYHDLFEYPNYIKYNYQTGAFEQREPWHGWYRG